MSLRPVLLALALAGATLAASSKEQVWIEVAAAHFTVMTDASAKEDRDQGKWPARENSST